MATAADAVGQKNFVEKTRTFLQEVRVEMNKVTWPDWPQVRQLSIGVVALALFVGAIIALMDLVLQTVFVRWLPALFG
jgi:preprotein translocase SecE subunit